MTYNTDRKEYQRQWRKANRDKVRGYEQKHREANREYYAERQRQWRADNPERAKEIDSDSYQRTRRHNKASRMRAAARDRATLYSLPFDLETNDIEVPTHCPVLGIELKSGHHDTRPELDRIIPEKGYVKGNVCVISGRANRIKWNATLEELEAVAEYVRRKS